jgi:hypothetical protein
MLRANAQHKGMYAPSLTYTQTLVLTPQTHSLPGVPYTTN